MKQVIIANLCVLALFASVLGATEIDSFSLRDEQLPDATKPLNDLMNGYIKQSLAEANTWGECNEDRFIDNLHSRIGGFFWTTFENDITSSPHIAWKNISRAESVYQDFSFLHAPALYIAKLGPILHIKNYFIGSDKLGHFIEEGFNYYRIINREKKSLYDALAFGEASERGHFGLATTGIYSHADLVANYQGYIGFWNRLIGPKGTKPIVTCESSHYIMVEAFDWKPQINGGWDEAINCNHYKNITLKAQAQARIGKLEGLHDQNLTCPIRPDECWNLLDIYDEVAPRLISPECL